MISAVILAYNDQDYIERAIESVSWCDEVIVVDDQSTDKTVARAKKHNATVMRRALDDNFAAQRNAGLSKAKGEWVLFLDSDEIVTSELQMEIKEAMTNASIQGYFLKRIDTMWGRELRYGETSDVRLLRLARKGSGVWERSVHEVWNIHGTTATLNAPLKHFPHPTTAEFLHEVNWYSTINAQLLFDSGVQVPGWHIVAYPVAKFIRNYIVHRGFSDGMPGLFIAVIMSFHSFLTRGKLYMLYHKKRVPLP
jgi:glycosyltransferase involved in cell wall biosynthesis